MQTGHREVNVALWDFGHTLPAQYRNCQYKHHQDNAALWDFGQALYTQYKGVIVRNLWLYGSFDKRYMTNDKGVIVGTL